MRTRAVPSLIMVDPEEALSTALTPPAISLAMQRMSGTLDMSTSVHVRPVVSTAGFHGGDAGPTRFALTMSENFTQPPTTASSPASPRPPSGRPTTERSVARLEYLKHWMGESLLLLVAFREEEEDEEEEDEVEEAISEQ